MEVNGYKIQHILGKGKFAKVYKAKQNDTKKEVAFKIIKCREDVDVEDEIKIHDMFDHPNIVKMYDHFASEDGRFMYMSLELVNGGELFDLLEEYGALEESVTRKIMYQLTSAMIHVHSHDVIHRDIKPENILLTADGDIRLADFGLAAYCPKGEKKVTFCGTTEYMPPEILFRRSYDKRIDIWCLGVLLFEMLTGEAPFQGNVNASIYSKIRRLDYKIPEDVPSEAADMIFNLLRRTPANRLTLEDMLQHPFLLNVEQDSIEKDSEDSVE